MAQQYPHTPASSGVIRMHDFATPDSWELPLTVRDAARFLGVSPQLVYAYVERKQIPHFRVMGRNIRFLRSDLEAFRAQFRKEVENGTATQA
jgi:excisionase family DNA binding protein